MINNYLTVKDQDKTLAEQPSQPKPRMSLLQAVQEESPSRDVEGDTERYDFETSYNRTEDKNFYDVP